MKAMEDLRDMLVNELHNIIEQGEITSGSLDIIDKLTHSIKSIDTIVAMEEAGYQNERGYSRNDGGYNDGYWRRDGYVRGRGNNSRHDSYGRYGNRMMEDDL